MERPSREAIETIMSITGVSEVVAAQKLEENWGDLNDAINAHFAGDRNTITSIDAPRNVATNIDDHLNPFSHVNSDLRRSLWDSGPDFTSSSPIVSHSGEVGEIPIEIRDGTEQSHNSVLAPNIDGFSGKSDAVCSGTGGTVITDGDVNIPIALSGDTSGQNGQKDDALHDSSNDTSRMPSSPGIDDFDYSNDIEEEMIRAAIEASRRDRGKGSLYLQRQYLLEDAELEEAVLLSLKTAEQEKALRELEKKFGASELDTCKSTLLGDLEKVMSLNGRLEMGSSSIQHGTPILEKQSLLRHRSRHVPSPSVDSATEIGEVEDDEYLASLQADREKELKATEEAEAQRLEEQTIRGATLEEERLKEEASCRKLKEEQGIKRRLAAKEASLPQEPTSDNENQLTIQVRMPDGSRNGRRFLKSDKLQSIFDFVDVGGWVKPGSYRLVRPYTQRALSDGETALTLNELGFTSEKEVIFLELV
ncbi:plant UBX domain-containing protein 8 isoform X1 [Rhododendron vialii]|uniref:plant UBX domain-containing protein 8 isoform X1 n=1 Tax=Rhododendron vialii TaxID=182163 RepID=UPI00265EDE7A|nr:plant UBX domain-containing protein 8 isoform X1 [Rhododendron vialii]